MTEFFTALAEHGFLQSAVIAGLLASIPGGSTFYLDVPEVNRPFVAVADRLSMSVVFETARMYTGRAPAIAVDKIFGVTSFELG